MRCEGELCLPGGYHIVVHLLQLLLGSVKGVRRRVKLVSLEALIRKLNLEWLIILLQPRQQPHLSNSLLPIHPHPIDQPYLRNTLLLRMSRRSISRNSTTGQRTPPHLNSLHPRHPARPQCREHLDRGYGVDVAYGVEAIETTTRRDLKHTRESCWRRARRDPFNIILARRIDWGSHVFLVVLFGNVLGTLM